MRNQFFGDVYDYIKYGLIRRLTNYGETPSALCWMMRPDEPNGEGKLDKYLNRLETRRFDPPVFDILLASRDRGIRNAEIIERSGLLPNTRFYSRLLTDDAADRKEYFREFRKEAKGRELICFDPDTGLQGDHTAALGEPDSSKYLMRTEANQMFKRGHSLLIFVHEMLVENEEGFIRRALHNLAEVKDATFLIAFLHTNVGFVLVPQADKIEAYTRIAKKTQDDWLEMKVVSERIA